MEHGFNTPRKTEELPRLQAGSDMKKYALKSFQYALVAMESQVRLSIHMFCGSLSYVFIKNIASALAAFTVV